MSSISLNFKCELKKFNLNVPITPNRLIFQVIISDSENINHIETAGIYKINYTYEDGKKNKSVYIT